MTPEEKLKLLLLRDFVYFAVIAAYFFLPHPFGILLMIGGMFLISRRVEKSLKASDARLGPAQKRTYFSVTCVYFVMLIGLLLWWVLRHPGPPAFAIAGLGFVVLLVLLYASYDSVYGRTAKV